MRMFMPEKGAPEIATNHTQPDFSLRFLSGNYGGQNRRKA
jgi:hypothetical protein